MEDKLLGEEEAGAENEREEGLNVLVAAVAMTVESLALSCTKGMQDVGLLLVDEVGLSEHVKGGIVGKEKGIETAFEGVLCTTRPRRFELDVVTEDIMGA
ncbi:hypothetical protein GOP47_0004348 [Adiantum capillus-veneris]|uniref:Uncharacterized protein n=1 Tax=Adiantum capillus-veneris TaxID=13818 RepID=A0A9D4V7B5_ADICA|nr:hypothetical protein GOP47_0004348 [Adiantum capillus-veneris]